MVSDSLSVRAEALLQHRDFVVGLAQELVGDLPRARRAIPVPRAKWVEPGHAEVELARSLALQQQVVAAVLALAEPYRTILLLRYYARLSVSEIARRRGDSDQAVRAQLERAMEILRGELDAGCEGGREAWTAGLLVLSRKARSLALLVRSAVLAVVVAAIAVPGILAWRSRARDAVPRVPPFPAVAVDPESGHLASIESVRASLASRSVPELIQVAVQAQRTLRERLLEPPADLRRSCASLLAIPSTGLARILHRGKLGTDEVNALGVKGAGSTFSFATLEHGMDQEPDLVLEQGHFISMGEGPGVLDLGVVPLEDLPATETPVPPELAAAEQKAWKVFWAVAIDPVKGFKPGYRAAVRALHIGPATPVPGHTYLVRGLRPGKHDVLAAFEAIAEDANGWTIAWRVLRIAPIGERESLRQDPYWWVPPPPEWHADLGVEPLIELLGETRSAGETKLLDPPDELLARFRSTLVQPGTKLSRLLSGERYAAVVKKPGGGANFSFAKGGYSTAARSDLELDGEAYSTRLGREACGVLLDFGLRSLESVGATREDIPDDLSAANREIWDVLWTLKPMNQGILGRAVAAVEEARVKQFAPGRIQGKVGHTYLLRSIVAGEHDVLVAFSLLARDEHGDWIAWKSIRSRNLPAAVIPKRAAKAPAKHR